LFLVQWHKNVLSFRVGIHHWSRQAARRTREADLFLLSPSQFPADRFFIITTRYPDLLIPWMNFYPPADKNKGTVGSIPSSPRLILFIVTLPHSEE
jgi:hypothetical protein